MANEIELERILKEYGDANKKSTNKRVNFFDDFFVKVRRGNREANDAIKIIDKAYLEDLKVEEEDFVNLQNSINALESDLTVAMDAYQKADLKIESETKKLDESKEKSLLPKQQIYRQETRDNSFKLDRLIKQWQDTEKEQQALLENIENEHRNNISDIEKKLRFDLNKENNNISSQSSEYQKRLLETNNRHEIKTINKKLAELKKNSLSNTNKIKLNQIDELIKALEEANL